MARGTLKVFWLLALSAAPLLAQGSSTRAPETLVRPAAVEDKPVVTRHRVQAGGRMLSYTATAGYLPIQNDAGALEARMFFVAYTLEEGGLSPNRPVTFIWQGGPGSPAALVQLTMAGPRRINMLPDGGMPSPPFRLVDNESTWLSYTDLVFVDPVGTGYSRAATSDLNKKFWSVQGDIESVAEFIRLYLVQFGRWDSPVFITGESYGGIRAGGIAGLFADRLDISLNGVILISAALEFHTRSFSRGNDLPYVLSLPTYTATAAFHRKLAPELLADSEKTLREVEKWAQTDYAVALMKGDQLSADERRATIVKLARYTGLSESYIDRANLRVEINRFCKELLRDERRTVGRVDTRFKGIDRLANSDVPEYDPGHVGYVPAVRSMAYYYIGEILGFKSDLVYEYYGYRNVVMNWNYGPGGPAEVDSSEGLRRALAKSPHLRMFVAEGYYDLAVPYLASEYTLSHMGLDPSQRSRVQVVRYAGGHSMYLDDQSRAKLSQDVARFIGSAIKERPTQ